MTTAANFEDYLKSSVMDLSNLERNRRNVQKTNNELNTFSTFNGSKLWLDIELDKAYNFIEVTNQTCLDFCMKNNFYDSMMNITDDKYREESARCHVNCMTKVYFGNEVMIRTLKEHPRTTRNKKEFIQIQQEVKKLNEEVFKSNSNTNFSV